MNGRICQLIDISKYFYIRKISFSSFVKRKELFQSKKNEDAIFNTQEIEKYGFGSLKVPQHPQFTKQGE
jgi:hypothetical protein